MLKRLKTIHERMSPSPKKQRADSMISPRREFSIPSAQNPPQRAKSFYCARSRGPELEPAVSDWVYDRLKKKKINSLNKNSKSDSNNNNEDKDQKEKIVKGPRRRTRRSSVPSCLFKTIRKPIQPGECGVLYVRIHQLQYNSLKKSYDLRFALKVGGQECSTSIVKSQNQGDTSYTLTFDEIFLFDVVSDFTIQITAIAQASHNLVRKPSILSPKKLLRKIQGREKDPYPIGTLDLRFPLEKSEKRFVTHSLSLEKNNSLHHALLTLEIGVMIVGKPQKIPEFDGKLKEKTMKGSFQCVVYEDYLKIFTRTGVYSQTWSKYFVVFKDRKLLLYADKDKKQQAHIGSVDLGHLTDVSFTRSDIINMGMNTFELSFSPEAVNPKEFPEWDLYENIDIQCKMYLVAESRESMENWLLVFKNHLEFAHLRHNVTGAQVRSQYLWIS